MTLTWGSWPPSSSCCSEQQCYHSPLAGLQFSVSVQRSCLRSACLSFVGERLSPIPYCPCVRVCVVCECHSVFVFIGVWVSEWVWCVRVCGMWVSQCVCIYRCVSECDVWCVMCAYLSWNRLSILWRMSPSGCDWSPLSGPYSFFKITCTGVWCARG